MESFHTTEKIDHIDHCSGSEEKSLDRTNPDVDPSACQRTSSPYDFGELQAEIFYQTASNGLIHIHKMLKSFSCKCHSCDVEIQAGYFSKKEEIEKERYAQRLLNYKKRKDGRVDLTSS